MEEEDLSPKESNSHTFEYLNGCTTDGASESKEFDNHVGIYMEETARTGGYERYYQKYANFKLLSHSC